MVESAMVMSDLSDEMIRAGNWLTAKLVEKGMSVAGSYWLYLPEANSWRLIISSREVSEQGPRAAYGRIQEVLSDKPTEIPDLALEDISVVTDNDPTYRLLRRVVKTGSGIAGIRFSRNVVDGHYIEDAWIYRLV
ncbi:MAG: hypothetical protein ACYC5O_05800 [Anaerolineae bacterium]